MGMFWLAFSIQSILFAHFVLYMLVYLSGPKRQVLALFYRGKWQQRKSGLVHGPRLEPKCLTPSPGPFALQSSLNKVSGFVFPHVCHTL